MEIVNSFLSLPRFIFSYNVSPIMKYTYTLFILLFFSVLTTQAQVTPTTTEGTQTETTVRNGIGRVGLEQPKSIHIILHLIVMYIPKKLASMTLEHLCSSL